MEWLSHSQKKHCELCKTSFRFTKLYASDMPTSLPMHVFLEHMTKWLFRNMLVWLRAILTISIWICFLPYFMRSVWSFMFWISDEGLGSSSLVSRNGSSASEPLWLSIAMSSGQCPVTPLQPKTMTTVKEVESMTNVLAQENLPERFVKLVLGSLGMPVQVNSSDLPGSWVAANNFGSVLDGSEANATSLLGDVSFFRNLTRSPMLNRIVISIVEGQIITVLVIIAFILVILVRDYVIQQQPEINMRAAFGNPDEAQPDLAAQAQAAAQVAELLPVEPDHEAGQHDAHLPEQRRRLGEHNAPIRPPRDDLEDLTDALRRNPFPDTFNPPVGNAAIAGTGPQRPETAADVQAGILEYLRIYREAHGDAATILRIMADEGSEDRLQYWADITRETVRRAEEASDGTDEDEEGDDSEEDHELLQCRNQRHAYRFIQPDIGGDLAGPSTGEPSGSGQQGATDESSTPLTEGLNRDILDAFGAQRPRAASDGSTGRRGAHPLASNTWSFANIAAENTNPDDEHHGNDFSHAENENVLASSGSHGGVNNDVDSSWVSDSNIHMTDAAGHDLDTEAPNATDAESTLHPVAPQPIDATEATDVTAPIAVAPTLPDANQDGVLARFANFMWGDLDPANPELPPAEAVPVDEADEQWVDLPINGGAVDPAAEADADGADPDADAAAAAFDQEAIEDMEDFDGVMELLGMRGPIAGLFQNSIFCAVLVSVTVFACIFIPYNIGRVTVWIMANPLRLVRMIVEFSKLVQDLFILFGGLFSWCVINIVDIFTRFIGGNLGEAVISARKSVWLFWTHAGVRVFDYLLLDFPVSTTEIQNFSAISHEALISVKGQFGSAFDVVAQAVGSAYANGLSGIGMDQINAVLSAVTSFGALAASYSQALLHPNAWVIDLGESRHGLAIDPELAYWSGADRFWAILAGYGSIFTIGALYLKRDMPFSTGDIMRAWEAGIIDTLHQASGIMKVILIISIEMLVFPLYCGLLLDIALLPLFEGATVASRVMFTYQYPLTSAFVHWFVGTGYMFHFALFVSMCRKIMRSGVLYFIRDPDDPEFHPIRDVLERNLTTQLRKILFSAFVYGALVIICLGGVVWGLCYTLPTVLPIHYSSNEPVLEFPVDLLFYNFLMPLAVKFFKPSDAIHAMYTWWFRRCARGLRLTFFLFGERKIDEEGILQLPADSEHKPNLYNRFFLELDERNRVVPKTWKDTFDDAGPKPTAPLSKTERRTLKLRKSYLVTSGQLVKDGSFVRAPASDRIKIPKGQKIFMTVSESNKRKDELDDTDVYGSDDYQFVYIPPRFRLRIFSFILFMWLFAAVTGVGFTIVPLVFGRMVFNMMIPEYVRTNDVYAFSIGVYLLGSAVYGILNMRYLVNKTKEWLRQARSGIASTDGFKRVAGLTWHAVKFTYAYFFLAVVFPLLVSALMELYVTIPLNTYMNPPEATEGAAKTDGGQNGKHSVRVIQAWVLGLLYQKLGTKMLTTTFPDSRASIAVQMVLRHGWANPDVSILTRGFVLPGLFVGVLAITVPPFVTSILIDGDWLGLAHAAASGDERAVSLAVIYRYSYPVAAGCAAVIRYALLLAHVFNGWTAGIRDEAYLIGERLHNFGAATAGARKAAQAWRAGGTRL